MKKKKLKKMINKFALVDDIQHLHERIDALEKIKVDPEAASNRILREKIRLIDERTKSLDNVKVQMTLDKTKELDNKIKILMDRTSTNYNACSDTGITFENGYKIIKCMADRGATQEELDNIKDYFNRYIFRCRLFKIYKTDQETEGIS